MQMYSEADVDTSILGDQKITILGYGSQGRAHALNLKDSGFNVVVGLRRTGASWAKAEADAEEHHGNNQRCKPSGRTGPSAAPFKADHQD